MPDEATFQDKKATVPVTCQQCGEVFWYKTDDDGWWPPPVLCPTCEAEADGITFEQAMEELFDA